ncbi:hypothetical protein LCGC14_1077620 [marine sediment metagenome]|uniref:Nucleoside 2-deoxyribosyltransferase n=1 Tax=marine sediment metagenome TaxID=412755 RepID=A0A0F9PZG7_9ZZZZ
MRVYLSGPMSGLTPKQASGWREKTTKQLVDAGFEVADPMRGTEKLHSGRKKLRPDKYPENEPSLSDKAFVQRDKFDVKRSDIILVNLLGAPERSVGTICEIAFNMVFGNLCVIAMEEKNVHNHPFIREGGVIFNNLDGAVKYVLSCAVDKPNGDEDEGGE